MPQRKIRTAQYAPTEAARPYMGEYSALAQQLTRDDPVYSVGQGIVNLAGDLGSAFINKRSAEKELAKEKKLASNAAMAERVAADPGLQGPQANYYAGTGAQPSVSQQLFAGPASPQQRVAAGMGTMEGNPQLAMQQRPNIEAIAQQFAPKYENVAGVGLVKVPGADGGAPEVALATPQKQELSPLSRLIAERDALPPNDPRRATYDAAIAKDTRMPEGAQRNVQTEAFDDGIYVINPDGTRGSRLGNAPARTSQPKMQTYYGEDGSSIQLDSNDPEDQKTIRDNNLVTNSPNDSERASKGFLDRMDASEKEINSLLEKNPKALQGVYDSVVKGIPIFGNKMVSDEYRQVLQKVKDWVRAKLRKESGAVIGDQEALDEFTTYYGIPGDDPGTLEGKRTSRVEARRQLATQAGLLGRKYLRGMDQPEQQPAKTPDYSKMTDEELKAEYAKRGRNG